MITHRALLLACVVFATTFPAYSSTVSGRVVDSAGEPIPDAQVFLEPGVTRPVRMESVKPDGTFLFDDVPPQLIGLFAYAPGRGFGGMSIQLGANDVQEGHTIVLGEEGRVALKIVGTDSDPLTDARVIGVGLQQSRVGIPLQKLRRFGFQTPTTDRNGTVVVPRMPNGEPITVKIAHAQHAQEVVRNIAPNSSEVQVKLTQGVLTSGSVTSQQRGLPVPNAPILFVNAEPPYDTSLTRANVEGVYYMRLRPGRYFYESFGADFASVRKTPVIVSGEFETQQIDLQVAATGSIRGVVLDAVTEQGVAGARILLETGGAPNSVATTGESGEYEFTVPEGPNVVRFRRALGYMDPIETTQTLVVAAHEEFEAPIFWVKSIPEFKLTIVDSTGAPVPGAVARLIQPEQLGWYLADENGVINLSVASLPSDRKLIVVVEDPRATAGATYTLDASDADSGQIALKPQSEITGKVENADGDGLAGWNVHCELDLGEENALRLWSATTDQAGTFRYPGVPTGVSLRYWAESSAQPDLPPSSPVLYTVSQAGASTLPAIFVADGTSGDSIAGESFPWDRLKGIETPGPLERGQLVVFASPTEFEIFLHTLATMNPQLNALGFDVVLVSRVPSGQTSDAVRVATGERPASAQSYVVNAAGVVIHETVGLPEFGLLRKLGSK